MWTGPLAVHRQLVRHLPLPPPPEWWRIRAQVFQLLPLLLALFPVAGWDRPVRRDPESAAALPERPLSQQTIRKALPARRISPKVVATCFAFESLCVLQRFFNQLTFGCENGESLFNISYCPQPEVSIPPHRCTRCTYRVYTASLHFRHLSLKPGRGNPWHRKIVDYVRIGTKIAHGHHVHPLPETCSAQGGPNWPVPGTLHLNRKDSPGP